MLGLTSLRPKLTNLLKHVRSYPCLTNLKPHPNFSLTYLWGGMIIVNGSFISQVGLMSLRTRNQNHWPHLTLECKRRGVTWGMTKETIGTVSSTPLEMTGGRVTLGSLGMQTWKLTIGVFTGLLRYYSKGKSWCILFWWKDRCYYFFWLDSCYGGLFWPVWGVWYWAGSICQDETHRTFSEVLTNCHGSPWAHASTSYHSMGSHER